MRTGLLSAWLIVAGVAASPSWAQPLRPDPAVTPGAVNPAVTQANVQETICVRGWTRTVRPPREFTGALKIQQIRTAGYADRRMRSYEEDHLIALELGGAPLDHRNLWPQPREAADGWTADRKDDLEHRLNQLVCAGELSLVAAQEAIATDWIAAYRTYVGKPGSEPDYTALLRPPKLVGGEVDEPWKFLIGLFLRSIAGGRLLFL